MTYMFILKCALKLVEEIILYYDARSKKQQITTIFVLGMDHNWTEKYFRIAVSRL